jgi:hypothetical protein
MDLKELSLIQTAQNRAEQAPLNIIRRNPDGTLRETPIEPTITPGGSNTTLPSPVANMSDGNITTAVTTNGVTTMAGAGDAWIFKYDLGAVYAVDFVSHTRFWASNTNTLTFYIEFSYNGSAWDTYYLTSTSSATNEPGYSKVISVSGVGRYVRLRVTASAAVDIMAKPYEFAAIAAPI